ncbi:MAG: cysteine desulfurase CsdA, partial [Parcubacteria group bacterium CG_4_9_14_0_2_um_filter_41_8]
MSGIKNTHKISAFDVIKIRNDFPVLRQKIYGKPLIYFDNAATTQKPRVVIETVSKLYSEYNSSVHRGAHYLSDQMTEMYE